jgi:thiol-disulfide isomerase/thioredoxin
VNHLLTKLGLGVLCLSLSYQLTAVELGDSISKDIHVTNIQKSGDLEKLKSVTGRVTMINFWATWCDACKVEIAEFEKMFPKLVKNKDFHLAFVSLDKDPKMASKWIRKNSKMANEGLAGSYHDADFVTADKLGVDAFPMTLILGKDGKIAHIQRGYTEEQKSTEAMMAKVQQLLK